MIAWGAGISLSLNSSFFTFFFFFLRLWPWPMRAPRSICPTGIPKIFPSGIPSDPSPSSSKSSPSSASSASTTVCSASSSASASVGSSTEFCFSASLTSSFLLAAASVFSGFCAPSPLPIGFRYIFFNSSGVIPDIFVQSIPLPIIISNDLCIQSRHTCNPPGSVIIFPA